MELPKIAMLDDDISKLTKAQMWGKFFLYASLPEKADYVQKLTETNGGIKMAFTVLKNVSQDELNWYHETRYWMHVSDELTMKNAARREGIAEGKHDKAVEAARNASSLGLTPQQISQITGLPQEEVQMLADKAEKN